MFVGKNSRKHYDFLPPRIELDLAIQGDGHQGATDEFATIPFHLVLFSAALVELTNSILVHSLILSSHLFLCLPLLFPFTVPCTIVLAKPEDFEMWPNHLSFSFLTRVRSYHILQWLPGSFCKPPYWQHGPSKKCYIAFDSISSQSLLFFSTSAAKVHNSQVYRNIGMTREPMSFIFDPRDMFLSLHIGFSCVKAAVACAILERTSGLEPSSETTALRYMKLVQYPDSALHLPRDAIGTVCHQSGLFSTDLHLVSCPGFVKTFN